MNHHHHLLQQEIHNRSSGSSTSTSSTATTTATTATTATNSKNSSSSTSITSNCSNSINLHSLTPAERLTRADDLLSDILDCCLWSNNLANQISRRTIKFTSNYRRPRNLNINEIKSIIHSLQAGKIKNLSEASNQFKQLPAVVSYISNAEPARFSKHIGLYLQLFLPKCGVKFFETDRYHQLQSPSQFLSSRKKFASRELRDLLSSSDLSRPSSSSSSIASSFSSSAQINPTSDDSYQFLSNHSTHLAVFATRNYSPNDIIIGCEGSFADLTEEEDVKLRSNAQSTLDSISSNSHSTFNNNNHHTDFSHLVNSRGKFQVFCGPARFVNHDCNNNVELLREGFTIKFKVIKPIKSGHEILTSYGQNYFGDQNCECMCETCEKLSRGAYARESSNDSVQLIKTESDEPINSLLAINTDTTDLSSLLDSSETTSATNDSSLVEPTLNPSSLIKSCSDSNLRSSSNRRQRACRQEEDLSISQTNFISRFKFTSTIDLTLPVLNSSINPSPNFRIFDPPLLLEPKSSSVSQEQNPTAPLKRKTYWITTKQKQLGILPWESCPPPETQFKQPYSPITPSLLGPSRRHSTGPICIKKRKREAGVESEKKLPFKSYWVSTKEKELGIVPWQPKPMEMTTKTQLKPTTRTSRVSRKATENFIPINGVPIAPRGQRLSYKVYEEGTEEAKLLNTAIGRELLGFRPRSTNKKELNNHNSLKLPVEQKVGEDEKPLELVPNQPKKNRRKKSCLTMISKRKSLTQGKIDKRACDEGLPNSVGEKEKNQNGLDCKRISSSPLDELQVGDDDDDDEITYHLRPKSLGSTSIISGKQK
ncbi:hypothetical protein O181_023298 [Austropuccinia psidii MF-1]|uniref:SET domain-containing protein n=1 Tax=Austropuccinia psidii MF-1 TaxID=1389203 RepID=A0A9Q3CII6_9BASI|nr:hypothetical protein [Austropuccinia psidii MF-1]